MQVKLTGLLNYAESPVEEAWARAAATAALKVGKPQPTQVYRRFEEPVIRRSAKAGGISTGYDRWIGKPFELFYTTPDGIVEGMYLETIARYLDDVSKRDEVVNFASSEKEMDISLSFESGGLTELNDMYSGRGIRVPNIFKRRRIEVPEGMTDTKIIQEVLRQGRFTYERLFKLFLDELRRR